MIGRRIIHAVTAWWLSRPTQRRIDRLKARRAELKGRIEAARQAHNTNALHVLYAQLKTVTTELLRLEQRRVAWPTT
jgi:hypothetical protein